MEDRNSTILHLSGICHVKALNMTTTSTPTTARDPKSAKSKTFCMAPGDGVNYVFTPMTAILTSKSFENPRWVFEYSSEMCLTNCLTGMASMSSAERRQYRLNG